MSLRQRDRRALLLLGVAGCAWGVMLLVNTGSEPVKVVGRTDSIPAAEQKLARLRVQASTVQGKQQLLQQVTAELAGREKGIFDAQTAAQAQAQLLDAVRRVGKAQNPPIEFGTVELTQEIRKAGDYGEVQISLPFNCRIEDLVNFLAELTAQPEAIATTEVRISAQEAKDKVIAVRLTVAGLVPQRLIPAKKKGLAEAL
jgi:hypothetical protein